ncbi:rod-binding protein [Pseudoroseomonas cervicalis]|uniref:rod-binding protein n=1 Tax=Teichococcus cervicalis TaxID=204525 RepID=UPI002781F62F|nr:rod-binding protein [Pseudoroseomonas cervicalis]MDQ1079535.1 flagellar protein FlgJ [Pseudoroseomonas cervicalis]
MADISKPVGLSPAGLPQTGLPAAPAAPRGQSLPEMRKAAEQFEAQVLGALLQPVFATLPSSGPFSGGAAEAQWRPMLVEEYGRSLTRAGGVGIAGQVLQEMLRLQARSRGESE